MIEVYGYTSCTSCRKTDAALKSSGVDYLYRDYFRDRFSQSELTEILERANLTPRDVLSKRSKVYQARAEEIDALDDDALLSLMLIEPTLLRRPLVIGDGSVIVGHNETRLADMVSHQQ